MAAMPRPGSTGRSRVGPPPRSGAANSSRPAGRIVVEGDINQKAGEFLAANGALMSINDGGREHG